MSETEKINLISDKEIDEFIIKNFKQQNCIITYQGVGFQIKEKGLTRADYQEIAYVMIEKYKLLHIKNNTQSYYIVTELGNSILRRDSIRKYIKDTKKDIWWAKQEKRWGVLNSKWTPIISIVTFLVTFFPLFIKFFRYVMQFIVRHF
ncbi:MAG: hypothetical protein IJ690_05875 [Clostridia bacterium]|nr:hypothetical protein [Bacteroidales bacterium]MBR1654455.1 hypothetical protein [Clostridia bacterium]